MQLLFSPDRFFEKRMQSFTLSVPVLVVVTAGVISAVPSAYFGNELSSALPRAARGPAQFGIAVTTIYVFLNNIFMWIGVSFYLHKVSNWFNNSGDLKRMLSFVGWSFFPYVIYSTASSFIRVLALPSVPRSISPAELQSIQHQVAANKPSLVIALINIVCTIWFGHYLIFAVRQSEDLDLIQAVVCVSPITGLLIASALYGTI